MESYCSAPQTYWRQTIWNLPVTICLVVNCIQTKGQKVLTQRHTRLCARYFYILKNFITFWYTSLGMRHYYQSPWDLQNDTKQSLKIITFTLKPFKFLCEWSLREWGCVSCSHVNSKARSFPSTSSSFPVLQM